ncbi:DUF2235 domain-containing protein [bacterium]|nr:DUF2235 domain-containing protein [bacterium]
MSKNIVVCYDGTGNEYGSNNTNVVGVFESIVRDQEQSAFYDPGVGTFSFWGRTLGRKIGTLLGKAFGTGLQQNIEDGYEYLMNRFEPGDNLFLFGFSRGAYTARALAGMIHRFGLLQKGSKNLIPYVSKMYTKREFNVAEEFKKSFCHECKPHFIGIWDTVGSLGFITGKKFFDTKLNPDVAHGYHAIAIDEQRKKFPVSLWDETKQVDGQVIEQVWFAGVHSDVGGWYTERHLSDISFAWMMDKAEACGLKLLTHWKDRLDQNASGVQHESRNGFWKLWRPVRRKIPEGAMIHQSVFDRMKNTAYNPTIPKKHKVVSNPSYPMPTTPPAASRSSTSPGPQLAG